MMRKRYSFNDGWKICRADLFDEASDPVWYESSVPTSVQDILCRNKVIPEKARNGTEDLTWIAEYDWIYKKEFSIEEDPGEINAELFFLGVDTVADFFLNGEKIGTGESMYLRKKIDITRFIKKDNVLLIRFHSPQKEIAKLSKKMPEEWKGVIDEPRLLRKALADSGTFLGNAFPCSCVGLYDEVFLEITSKTGRIQAFHTDQSLSYNLLKGGLDLSVRTDGAVEGTVRYTVLDPAGKESVSCECEVRDDTASCTMELSSPELWWPHNYGPQNLYRVCAELICGGQCVDRCEKRIGFRLVEYEGDFRFKINRKRIRIWGSNIVNVDGLTHWCDRDRLSVLMDYARDANFNILRVWGEAPLLPDLFYELADEMGILIWQDFGIGFGPWPDDSRYRELFRAEVSQMVERLRHHPSILLWCGSNETYMTGMSEPLRNGPLYGYSLIFQDAPEICRRLDPARLYIPSTPMGGNYPQDASAGDMHGYWGNDFEPGLEYPVLFSESCHATTYCRHSMLRFMTEEEIWPEGCADVHVYKPDLFETAREKGLARKNSYALAFQNYWRQISVPGTWKGHLSGFAQSELFDLENYFDAYDLESVLYKYAVCGADFYKREIERIRRGRSCRTPFEPRKCSGYLTWKYNDAWPHVNFTQIDYYLEPAAQYYALKRAFAPALAGVSAEQDHLYLWAVNDTPEEIRGEIILRVFSRLCNEVTREIRYPVYIRPDESKTIDCLDHLGPLPREMILHTEWNRDDGKSLGTNLCYLDKERNLTFPKPKLKLAFRDGELEVRTDQYARFIELTGESASGDRFGWKFSENYFDLLPFETKRIRIRGNHGSGKIMAKAFYGEETEVIDY